MVNDRCCKVIEEMVPCSLRNVFAQFNLSVYERPTDRAVFGWDRIMSCPKLPN